MRYIALFIFLIASNITVAQSNIIFSIPSDYTFTIDLGGFTFSKPQTWQAKFDNIPAGEYKLNVTLIDSRGGYAKTLSTTFKVVDGYEATYFVSPLSDKLIVSLAGYYTLKQLYNGAVVPTSGTGADGRLTVYNGKPVFSVADIADLKTRTANFMFGNKMKEFLRTTLKNGYLYVDDLVQLLSVFMFDNDRLEVAKFGFHSLIDKHKTYKLSGSFFYSSHYEDFQRYISQF